MLIEKVMYRTLLAQRVAQRKCNKSRSPLSHKDISLLASFK